jgi:AraC-like DNA-binding protein
MLLLHLGIERKEWSINMKNQLEQMYEDIFSIKECVPDKPVEGLNPEGKTFTISPPIGQGYCWVYRCNEAAAVTIMKQTYYDDFYCQFNQPDFLCIGYYYSVSGEQFQPYRRLASNTVQAYVGQRGVYRAIHHKDVPVHSISIIIMPEYYESYLQSRFSDTYEPPEEAFASLSGITEFPELLLVLNQIKNYMGTGMAAKLFYKSKVDEVISLVMHKAKELKMKKSSARKVSGEDILALNSVVAYINDHFALKVNLGLLARIACMSPAKLRYTFKAVYGCTISEYIQNKRIGQAEHLLLYTDLSIAQIAKTIGYQKHVSFSEMFKKHTGLTPKEYRKACTDVSFILKYARVESSGENVQEFRSGIPNGGFYTTLCSHLSFK